MNYLGHLLLSGDDPHVITGNFMADAVKGRDLSSYPEAVQRGIRLHRRIDVFTDSHALTRIGRERLYDHCGKYAGVALDLFYDHCIAAEWSALGEGMLNTFAARMYDVLQAHEHLMPDRTRRMLPYMVKGDWLTNYARIEGIAWALEGLSKRAVNAQALVGAEVVLTTHYDAYVLECSSFLRELRMHLNDAEG
jgi:acyl carrier protein phosphodiesterase